MLYMDDFHGQFPWSVELVWAETYGRPAYRSWAGARHVPIPARMGYDDGTWTWGPPEGTPRASDSTDRSPAARAGDLLFVGSEIGATSRTSSVGSESR